MVFTTADNNFATANLIVNPVAGLGTHTTLQAALAVAVSGQNICVMPGTYSMGVTNFTLVPGVNIFAHECDGETPNVIITSGVTLSSAGTVTISGCRLAPASTANQVNGSGVCNLIFDRCFIQVNAGVTFLNVSNSNAATTVTYNYCKGNLGGANTQLHVWSSPGTLSYYYTAITNTGGDTHGFGNQSGNVIMEFCEIDDEIFTSNTGGIAIYNSTINTSAVNTAALNLGGSGTNTIVGCTLSSGTASAATVGATASIYNSTLISSNTNAIAGAGTIKIGGLTFVGSSGIVGTLTTSGSGGFMPGSFGTTGQILTSNGAGVVPTFQAPATSGTVTSVSGTANQVAVATGTTTPVISLIGPYTPATYTAHGVLIGEGTSSIAALATGTAGQVLQSGGASADPAYSTSTYPTTNAVNTLLYASSANVMAALPTANNGVLVTSASGVPSIGVVASWTPNLQVNGSNTGITYTSRTGTYIQIGNVVLLSGEILLSSKGAGSGNVTISNLPVATGSGTGSNQAMPFNYWQGFTNAGFTSLAIQPSGTSSAVANITMTGSGQSVSNIQASQISNTFLMEFTGIYFVD